MNLDELVTKGASATVAYPTAPETLAPDWKQIAEALREQRADEFEGLKATIRDLKTQGAQAQADADANADTCYDEQCRRIRAERARDSAVAEAKRRTKEADAFGDLLTELAAFMREGWESDEQANRIKAALTAHEKQYGTREAAPDPDEARIRDFKATHGRRPHSEEELT